jgi:hypothetical protein
LVSAASNDQKGTQWKSISVAVNWAPPGKAEVVLEGIHPGLFHLRAKHGDETSTAWILVVQTEVYPVLSKQFEDFVRQTVSWGDGVSADTKRAYQRAYLEYLASSNSGNTK